jgi:DNA mismatch repair protein MutL
MGRIRLLPDAVINQIAAGEVVERPASVVKELVENSLDAGATQVSVYLEAGGRALVQVDDDGCGMDADDALLALERHATSKIASAEDLAGLATLGFRGEALPSIAAVSQLTLETASVPGEGTRVRVAFGRLLGQEPCPRPQGTRVKVERLFAQTPARLKFLRSPVTELRHIVETLQALAFAYPEVSFVLWHGRRKLLHVPKVADRASRLFQLMGQKPPEPLQWEGDGLALEMFLLPPTPSRQLVVAINRRVVRDRLLSATLARALRSGKGEWQADLFLHLQLPAGEVDFNVHPAKAEVRFANPGRVSSLLTQQILLALERAHGAVPVRLPEPAGTSSPGAFVQPHTLGFQVAEAVHRPTPAPAPPSLSPSLPWGRYLGQYRNTYLLVEDSEGLKLVDQHVAHERVLYERFLQAGERTSPQPLLIAEILEVPPALSALVLEFRQELLQAGLELEVLSGNSLRLLSLPAGLPASAGQELLLGLLQDLSAESLPGRSVRERIAASLACRAAIKKNTPLAPLEAEQLLRDLAQCRDPHRCPHGRPIVLSLSQEEIERRIGRRGS